MATPKLVPIVELQAVTHQLTVAAEFIVEGGEIETVDDVFATECPGTTREEEIRFGFHNVRSPA